MKLSLAIINDNEALYLKRFFESLGSWKDLLDIVFVDNCSCDNSIQIVKDLGIRKIVTFKKEVSRPVLYNAAASRIEGEYVLFTHSDIIFGDGFFKNLEGNLKEKTDLDFMNFRVMYVDKTTSAPSIVYWDFKDKRIKLSYQSIWGISDPARKKLTSCSESCFLVDSTVFKHEHFDERYFDTLFIEDLLLKLDFQGANIAYDEDSYIEHYFLEEHKRLRTLKYDIRLFIKNNFKELQGVNLVEQDKQISSLETNLQEKVAQIAKLEASLQERVAQINSLEYQIQQIQHSIPMQLVNRYKRVIERLLRRGTRRRRYYELGLTGIRVILNEGWKSFFRKMYRKILEKLLLTGARTRYYCRLVLTGLRVIRNEGWKSFFRKVRLWFILRRAATKKPRYDLPKFNASISKKEADKLVFPVPSEKPEASIVIPAYNNWKYTVNCLKSICENTTGDYEVFVIDDASTDATAEVLPEVKNLHLVTNKQNAGFLESCNRGARASKGKYILFLNNDTMVTKGWLPPLLELIKRADVGIVGSKLVYPGGTLQEAGGIIWNDGSGWNYGRGDDPDKPEYNYVREVDYCSGASLMVKRELFEKIGGFDERFKPAYGEDSDLCFSLRKLGYRVMYQPMSVIVHFEGVSCGTDTSSGIKKYQEINKPKFVEKWSPVLQKHHYPPADENAFLARDRVPGKRILVIGHYVPTYDKDAGSLWIFNILKILTELGHKVTFTGDNLLRLEPYTQGLQQKGIEVIYSPYFWSVKHYIKKCGRCFDVIFLSRTHISIQYIDILRHICKRSKFVFLTHELSSISELRRCELEGNKEAFERAERIRLDELHIARNSDCTVAVSPVEKQKLLSADPNLHIEILSSIYDVTPPQRPFSQREGIMFLGGFSHPPNVDSVLYFVNEILPLIGKELPYIRLYIVGSNPPKDVVRLRSSSIEVIGHVKDLTPYFESSRVFVAPLRYGAGVKGKIVQSMAHGLPTVTTSIGSEGMGLVEKKTALIADSAKEFADKVVLLYNDEDLWYKLSNNSMEHVFKNYSYEVAKNKLEGIIFDLTVDAHE